MIQSLFIFARRTPKPKQALGGLRAGHPSMKSPRRVASRRAIVTHLPEVTRVILIHHNSVMVLTTSHTATRRVLAVLADAAVTGGNVTALLAVLVQLRIRGKTNRTNIAASVDRSSRRRKHSFPSILHHRSGRCTPRRGAAIPPIPGCDPRVWKTPKPRMVCNPPSIRVSIDHHAVTTTTAYGIGRSIAFDSFAFGARAVVADVLSSACLRVVKRRNGRCGKRGNEEEDDELRRSDRCKKVVNGHFDSSFYAFVRGMHAFVSRCKISFEFDTG